MGYEFTIIHFPPKGTFDYFLLYKTDHMVSFCSWIKAFQTCIWARHHSVHQKNAQAH